MTGVPFSGRTGHAGGMRPSRPPSYARNLAELYVRAYWRYYATAIAWAGGTSLLLPTVIHR